MYSVGRDSQSRESGPLVGRSPRTVPVASRSSTPGETAFAFYEFVRGTATPRHRGIRARPLALLPCATQRVRTSISSSSSDVTTHVMSESQRDRDDRMSRADPFKITCLKVQIPQAHEVELTLDIPRTMPTLPRLYPVFCLHGTRKATKSCCHVPCVRGSLAAHPP